VLQNISKLYSAGQWRIPVVGLVVSLGVVGLGVIGQQTKLVLNNVQNSVDTPLLQRLREVRDRRNQLPLAFQSKDLKTAPTTTALGIRTQESATGTTTALPKVNFPQKDGVYLYGQSPKANEIGQGYIIFEKRQGMLKGALYMPSSEFSCFQGTLEKSGELAMTVTGSPDQGSTSEVASSNGVSKVADDQPITYAYSVALQDYHRLNSISAGDRSILQVCNQPSGGGYRKLVK
jgi:hypothetical protein